MRKTYIVPAKFYLDHENRECGETDNVIKRTKTRITVELDEIGYKDLFSDADYYWYCRDEICDNDLANSAKRTMDALKKVGAPNE